MPGGGGASGVPRPAPTPGGRLCVTASPAAGPPGVTPASRPGAYNGDIAARCRADAGDPMNATLTLDQPAVHRAAAPAVRKPTSATRPAGLLPASPAQQLGGAATALDPALDLETLLLQAVVVQAREADSGLGALVLSSLLAALTLATAASLLVR